MRHMLDRRRSLASRRDDGAPRAGVRRDGRVRLPVSELASDASLVLPLFAHDDRRARWTSARRAPARRGRKRSEPRDDLAGCLTSSSAARRAAGRRGWPRRIDRHPDVWMAKPLHRSRSSSSSTRFMPTASTEYCRQAGSPTRHRAPSAGRRARTISRAQSQRARLGSDLPDAKPRLRAARASGRRSVQLPMVGDERHGGRRLRHSHRAGGRTRADPAEPSLRYARPHAYFTRGRYAETPAPLTSSISRGSRSHVIRVSRTWSGTPLTTVTCRARAPGCRRRPDLVDRRSGVDTIERPRRPRSRETVDQLAERYR